jgi:uncharacterized SAM-binding protein YcdF (DUF218 family)
MSLSPSEVQKITRYLDAATPLPAAADLIFVPGTRLPTPALIAADLFRRRIAPIIVLTGGDNRHTGENEARAHVALLREQGIALDSMIMEDRSTNTLENVTFALPLIAEQIALEALTSIVIVAKWMHSRRVLMTLKRHMPAQVRYYAHTYDPEGVTRENWHLHPREESANVMKNWERIPQYLAWGHLAEVTRDGDAFV